jgi:hypothetical protein
MQPFLTHSYLAQEKDEEERGANEFSVSSHHRDFLWLRAGINAPDDTQLLHPEVQGRAVQSQSGCGTAGSGENPPGLFQCR